MIFKHKIKGRIEKYIIKMSNTLNLILFTHLSPMLIYNPLLFLLLSLINNIYFYTDAGYKPSTLLINQRILFINLFFKIKSLEWYNTLFSRIINTSLIYHCAGFLCSCKPTHIDLTWV